MNFDENRDITVILVNIEIFENFDQNRDFEKF